MRKLIPAMLLASSCAAANDDLKYLAEAVYFEARSEPLACQIIVAQVVMNRVYQERFPDTVKGVVHQKKKVRGKYVCQYSYHCDGKSDVMSNARAEIKAYQVASMVLLGDVPDFSEGADHYYAQEIVIPAWDNNMENKFVCDKHTFGTLDW